MPRPSMGRPWSSSLRSVPTRETILDLGQWTRRADRANFTRRCDRSHPDSGRPVPIGWLGEGDGLFDTIRHWLAGVQIDGWPPRLGGVRSGVDVRVLLREGAASADSRSHLLAPRAPGCRGQGLEGLLGGRPARSGRRFATAVACPFGGGRPQRSSSSSGSRQHRLCRVAHVQPRTCRCRGWRSRAVRPLPPCVAGHPGAPRRQRLRPPSRGRGRLVPVCPAGGEVHPPSSAARS